MCDQQSLRSACAYAQSDQSLCLSLEYSMTVKLLTQQHLEFLSISGGCTGSSTHVKMPHCWKSHAAAHLWSLDNKPSRVYCIISGWTIFNKFWSALVQTNGSFSSNKRFLAYSLWRHRETVELIKRWHVRIQRGIVGPDPPPPTENYKHIGFLTNTGPDPLENHKATQPAFNAGPPSARVSLACRWWPDFSCIWIHSLTKKIGPFLKKNFWVSACVMNQRRVRKRRKPGLKRKKSSCWATVGPYSVNIRYSKFIKFCERVSQW